MVDVTPYADSESCFSINCRLPMPRPTPSNGARRQKESKSSLRVAANLSRPGAAERPAAFRTALAKASSFCGLPASQYENMTHSALAHCSACW